MTVFFIGAGPGDPDLITIKGRDLIRRCQTCLYAGSLVPEAVVAESQAETIMDTASMTLDDIMSVITTAHADGHDIARVHSGDPSLYGAIAEQIRRLKTHDIDYKIIPGVPAYAAAAAEMGIELTIPEVTQSIILTRTAMKSSPMPEG
jgi:precorrin-4/cobalt-precorrin-4 C11-methyltransferase